MTRIKIVSAAEIITILPEFRRFLEPNRQVEGKILKVLHAFELEGRWDELTIYLAIDKEKIIAGALHPLGNRPILMTQSSGGGSLPLTESMMKNLSHSFAVSGPRDSVKVFRDTALRQHRTIATDEEQGLYIAREITLPKKSAGNLKVASQRDLERAVDWTLAFVDECHLEKTDQSIAEKMIMGKIHKEELFLWEYDNKPVAMMSAADSLGSSSIALVYTPKESRGKGYASNLVAEVSARKIRSGLEYCFLFTQMDNPTSNKIYQNIGYELKERFLKLTFLAQ